MKQLLVVRHAKSSWANIGQDDFDRPLNERGSKDAPAMAERIKQKGIRIDQFISSPAVRAFTTATHFAAAYHQKPSMIIPIKQLYHAPASVYVEVIQTIDDQVNTAAIFAHNPGITDFVNQLTDQYVPNMPTSGIFAIKIHTKHWLDFVEAKKEYWFFDYPKLQ